MMIIADSTIRTCDGNYSITDLHKASGGKNKHRPNYFLKLKSTQELIAELEAQNFRSPDDGIYKPVHILKGVQTDGTPQGTYVCLELVYSYAMWISPKFALVVIRTFYSIGIRQNQLTIELNQLCAEFAKASEGASHAGRYLNLLGRKVKPELKKQIDDTLIQMQPSLNFDNTDELPNYELGGNNDE